MYKGMAKHHNQSLPLHMGSDMLCTRREFEDDGKLLVFLGDMRRRDKCWSMAELAGNESRT